MKDTANRTITVKTKAMRAALSIVRKAMHTRTTIPIPGTVKLTFAGTGLTIRATDLDNIMAVTIDADGCPIKQKTILIEPQFIALILRVADDNLTFTISDDTVEVSASGVTSTINLYHDVADWPTEPKADPSPMGKISASILLSAIEAVKPSISSEITRYYLHGIYAHQHDGQLRMVATDGHRLSIIDTQQAIGEIKGIIPVDALSILSAAARSNPDGLITIHASPARMTFEAEGWRLNARLIDETYPDYFRAIPREEITSQVTLSRRALRAVQKPAHNRAAALIFEPDKGIATQNINAPYGSGATITIPIGGHGHSFGLNARYLQAVFQGGDTIRLNSHGKKCPISITTANPNITQIIMPMYI